MPRALILVPAALAAALLAGCSSSSGSGSASGASAPVGATEAAATAAPTATVKPEPFAGKKPAEIFDQARAAADDAKSVHVAGTVFDGKDKVKYDLSISKAKGGLATGNLTVKGDRLTVRRIGKTMYFKAGKHFYTSQGGATNTVAGMLAGKWIKGTKSQKDLADMFSLTTLDGPAATGIFSLPQSDRDLLQKVAGKTVNGQATVGLWEKTADPDDEGTLYVSTGKKALPLLLTGLKGQKVTFSDWDKKVTVTAPKGALSGNG